MTDIFLAWLSELVNQLVEVDLPDVAGLSTHQKGFKKGCYETQRLIGNKLKHALEAEKIRIEKEAEWQKEMNIED